MKTHAWQFDGYGDLDVLKWREVDIPDPGPGEAVVRLRAVGMNRSELRYIGGTYAPAQRFPTCLGQEGVGEIVALGPPDPALPPLPSTPLRVGARVALLPGRIDVPGMGSYREHGVYKQSALAAVPEGFSDVEGAALWMGTLTALGGFSAAHLDASTAKGKRVLITAAASGIGVIALKAARAWGATTYAVTRTADKAQALAAYADHVIVCAEPKDLAGKIREATEGKGFDVAFDPVGAEYTPGLVEAAGQLAHIVVYEMMTGREAKVSLPQMLIKDLGLHGFTLFRLIKQPALVASIVAETLRLGDALRPVIAATFPLREAPRAFEAFRPATHLGKIVLTDP